MSRGCLHCPTPSHLIHLGISRPIKRYSLPILWDKMLSPRSPGGGVCIIIIMKANAYYFYSVLGTMLSVLYFYSFIIINNLMIKSPFCRWRNQSTERLNNFPKVGQCPRAISCALAAEPGWWLSHHLYVLCFELRRVWDTCMCIRAYTHICIYLHSMSLKCWLSSGE